MELLQVTVFSVEIYFSEVHNLVKSYKTSNTISLNISIGSVEPLNILKNSVSSPFSPNQLPVVSLTSSSSTSSSCTQLAETTSDHSTETGDDLDTNNPEHVIHKTSGALPPQSNKKEGLLNIYTKMNAANNDDKPFYSVVSDTITEPLLSISHTASKLHNGTENSAGISPVLTNGVCNVAVNTPTSSAANCLENGRKISDISKNVHKNSLIDFKTEARNRDQTRSNWSDSNVRKTSKPNERRQSISSEESLSDYEELGINHTSIHGDITSHRSSR